MTYGEIIDTVMFKLGKDTYGGIVTPDNINAFGPDVNNDLTDLYLKVLDRDQLVNDITAPFLAYKGDNTTEPLYPDDWGYVDFPTDYIQFISASVTMFTNDSCTVASEVPRIVEWLTEKDFDARLSSFGSSYRPTRTKPIGTVRENKILIRPKGIVRMNLAYFRQPAVPFFDYDIDTTSEQWYYLAPGEVHDGSNPNFAPGDPSLSVEFEWKNIDPEIIKAFCDRFSVMIKDYDLLQAIPPANTP